MPIYEYRCTKGHSFEVLQRMADEPLESCERCGAPAERVLHAPAVHFKGSGFYNTDYGTKKRAREKSAESKSEAKSGDNGSKPASDAKSDAKKPEKPSTTSSSS